MSTNAESLQDARDAMRDMYCIVYLSALYLIIRYHPIMSRETVRGEKVHKVSRTWIASSCRSISISRQVNAHLNGNRRQNDVHNLTTTLATVSRDVTVCPLHGLLTSSRYSAKHTRGWGDML